LSEKNSEWSEDGEDTEARELVTRIELLLSMLKFILSVVPRWNHTTSDFIAVLIHLPCSPQAGLSVVHRVVNIEDFTFLEFERSIDGCPREFRSNVEGIA